MSRGCGPTASETGEGEAGEGNGVDGKWGEQVREVMVYHEAILSGE